MISPFKDWEKLLVGLEESRVLLESVWNTVNLLNIVTDKLDMDRFTTVRNIKSKDGGERGWGLMHLACYTMFYGGMN